MIPNGCAAEIFPPVHMVGNPSDKPTVLGYVGTIGEWFDWSWLIALAEANPSMCIRLIGPVYVDPPKTLLSNIELLPACDHGAAIESMQKFSVGLIPFKNNELTASVDPIKYYEYRALGLPIVSSSFGEMAGRRNEKAVFLADAQSELRSVVREALTYKCDACEIEEFRTQNSWGTRFEASGMFS